MSVRALNLFSLVSGVLLLHLLFGCKATRTASDRHSANFEKANCLLADLRSERSHDVFHFYRVGVEPRGGSLVVTGAVDSAEAKSRTLESLRAAGLHFEEELEVLPEQALGEQVWGICTVSVGNGREGPQHKAELGTQLLMGEVVRVLKGGNFLSLNWYLVQGADGYVTWQQVGNIARCTREEADQWLNSRLLIITQFETEVHSEPKAGSAVICNAVLLNKLQYAGEVPGWYRVRLPDNRQGYIQQSAAEDLRVWRASRKPTPEAIEQSAMRFVGRPYLWGGNSPFGLDCSGFTKLVFGLNGIDLLRNAGHQARQGEEVSLANNYSALRKGDLLFFGRRVSAGQPERVTHVGIYLGDLKFIHSADYVRVSSLDPFSPMRDIRHSKGLLYARRILKD